MAKDERPKLPGDDEVPLGGTREEGSGDLRTSQERIDLLKSRLEDLSDGEMTFWEDDEADPDVIENFLENVIAYESSEWSVPLDDLHAGGLEVIEPCDLDDEALPGKLRELVQALALRHIFVLNTDHLSDRELYTRLVEEELREEAILGPPVPGSNFIIDMVGSGSDEDIDLTMRYYADDAYRQSWQRDFPEYDMPPREKPPYNRDRTLPKPNWGLPENDDELIM